MEIFLFRVSFFGGFARPGFNSLGIRVLGVFLSQLTPARSKGQGDWYFSIHSCWLVLFSISLASSMCFFNSMHFFES